MKAFLALWMIIALAGPLLRAVPPPPSPGDQMLFIYIDRPYDNFLVANMKAALALLPSPPTITDLKIPVGSKNGFYDELTAAGLNLNNYCQVWDLRFNELNNGVAYTGTVQEDSITTSGANNDDLLYRNFLAQGGHLFVMGENDGFYARNEGLMQFVADATGFSLSYPTNTPSWTATTVSNAGPEFFQTAYDSITTPLTFSTYPGEVPLTGVGNGTPLTHDASYTVDLLWESSQLTSGNGKMMVTFDSNFFGVPDAQSDKYVRNAYTTLSACYNFSVSKSASASTVCAGDPLDYTICWQNTGLRSIPPTVVSDTIPNCMVFQSASIAPSGHSGQLYWWNLASIAPGPQQCLMIHVLTQVCP